MNRATVKTGQWELVICMALPLGVVAALLLFGFIYDRKQERHLAQRAGLLNLIPVLEQKAGAAHKVLKPFVIQGVAKDMAADLSLCVSDAAQKFGFVIRSSNVEKQIGTGTAVWMDYKLTLSGDGPLASLIAMLDYLGQPQRRFQATQVNIKATQLSPETTYSADLVLVVRVVVDRNGDSGVGQVGTIIPATAETIGAKLDKATEGVKSWAAEPASLLSLKKLQNRVPYVEPIQSQVEAEPQVSFRLTGVVGNKAAPMIMTDQGVFGVGDEVDGFKVEAIGADKVTVVSKGGRREIVRLYRGGGGL
jgi:hypothetical protein